MGWVNYEGYTLEDALASVGKGWEPLIRELFDQKPDGVKIEQVKEKFGILRVYSNNSEFDKTVILPLERKSITICENCGNPGILSNFQVLCDTCRK